MNFHEVRTEHFVRRTRPLLRWGFWFLCGFKLHADGSVPGMSRAVKGHAVMVTYELTRANAERGLWQGGRNEYKSPPALPTIQTLVSCQWEPSDLSLNKSNHVSALAAAAPTENVDASLAKNQLNTQSSNQPSFVHLYLLSPSTIY